MKAGKKTYIKRVREILDYEEVSCGSQIGMATEQACFQLDNILSLNVVYSPYQGHEFILTIILDTDSNVLNDTFGMIVYNYKNVFKDTPKREFKDKEEFINYINECLSYLKPTYIQIRKAITNYIKEQIDNGKSMKRLLEDDEAVEYISTLENFTEEEIEYLYLKSNNDSFLSQEAKDIFLF